MHTVDLTCKIYLACLLQLNASFKHICIDMHACTIVFFVQKKIRSRERETIQQSERLNHTFIYICIHMEGT